MTDLAGLAGPTLDCPPADRVGQSAAFVSARVIALLGVTQATRPLEAHTAAAVGALATLVGTGADVVRPTFLAVAACAAVDEVAALIQRLSTVLVGAGELGLAGGGDGTHAIVTPRVGRRANDAALAAVLGVEGEFDADIDASLLALWTGASLGRILLILFLAVALPLAFSFAFPLALLLAVRQDVIAPVPLSPPPGLREVQRLPTGQPDQC